MKKLLYLFFTITLVACSSNENLDVDEFSSLSQELKSNIYFETTTGNWPYEAYYTFDFDSHIYKIDIIQKRPEFAGCYSTSKYGVQSLITSDEKNTMTCVSKGVTYYFMREGDEINISFVVDGSLPAFSWNVKASSLDERLKALSERVEDNTCN